jgi:MFS family permease
VMGVWVKTLTGSNGAAGLTFLFLTLPALVAPVFGFLVDRVPRRGFLVVVNLLSALVVLPLLLVDGAEDVWIIYGVAFLYGVAFVVVPAALNGLMKDLLPEEVLVDANASLSVTREAFRLVGPLAGAALFAVAGGGVVAVVDAITFVAAAAAIGSMAIIESRPERHELHWRAEMSAGVAHIRATPVLLHMAVALGLCLLVLGFAESAFFGVLDAFDKPAEFVGPILTAQGVGALTGGLLSSRLIRRIGEPRGLFTGLLLLAAGLAGVVVAAQVWHLFVAAAVLGSGIPMSVVAFNTLLQRRTPARLMGRVSTATEVLVTTPQAVSIALGALLVTLLDYRVIFGLMTSGTLVAAGYLLVALRGRLSEPAPEPEHAQGVEEASSDAPVIPGSVLSGNVNRSAD